MADDNPTTPSVSKQTRRFAPIRGRGGRPNAAGRGGRSSPATTKGAGESTTDSSAAVSDAGASSSTTGNKPIGNIRPDTAQEGRLPSVHDGQRTRGGAMKMKFKPTVPTRRNKKEVTASAIDEKLKTEGGDRGRGRGRGRGAGRGRGRGRGGPMDVVAQTTASGFFSLGPSAMSSRARQYGGGGGGGYTHGGDASGNRHEPESSEASDMINLFADGGHDGMLPVVFQHVSRTAGELDPSDLTARRNKIPWLEVKSKKPGLSATIKKEVVKQEPSSDDEDKMDMDKKPETGSDEEEEVSNNTQPLLMDDDAPAQNIFGINEKRQLVSVADDELLFFQLPSVMPKFEEHIQNEGDKEGEGEEGGDEEEDKKDKKKDEDVEMKDKVKLEKGLPPAAKIPALEEAMQSLELSEMPEGQIGKLVVYKSGKMKLKVGDVLLEVQQGMRSSFLEDVMVLDTESDDKKKVIELGHIVQKFVCMPDMDALLEGEE